MITDKLIKGIIKITCIFMPVIFIFSSCGSKNVDDFPYIPADAGELTEMTEIRVVLGEGASSSVVDAAGELCLGIKEQTGVNAYTVYGSSAELEEGCAEILIGNTSHEASIALISGMRSEDYACRELNGRIVMGGKSDSATVKAIERFCREILPVSTKYRLIPENGGFEYKGEYRITSLDLNGADLDGYRIVLPKSADVNITEAVYFLRDRIAETTGYWLDTVGESKWNFTGNAIYLDLSGESEIAEIEPTSYGIRLIAADTDGISVAIEELCRILGGRSGNVNIEIPSSLKIPYVLGEYRLGILCLEGKTPFLSASDVSKAVKPIVQSNPHVLLTDEIDSFDREQLKNNLSEYTVASGGSYENDAFCLSRVGCTLISESRDDGLITKIYKVGNGSGAFVLVHVSGGVNTDTSYGIPKEATDEGLPTVVVFNTVRENADSGEISFDGGEMYLAYFHSYSSEYGQTVFECYADPSGFEYVNGEGDGTLGYVEICVEPKIERAM